MTANPSPQTATKSAPRIRPVPAVTRAVAILRLLGKTKEPMNVKSISDALGLVPSTCLHILRALTAEKLLAFDSASKRYRLGTGMLVLARSVMETNSFAQVVQPALDLISKKWGVTAIGVEVVDLHHMVVTALSRSELPFRLHVDVGSRFPGLISATGRLVAAYSEHTPKEIAQQFKSLRWQQPIPLATWQQEVEQARINGYSVDNGSYIAGVAIIAVPVLDTRQRITHTIVTAGIANQLNPEQTSTMIQELMQHARYTSNQLYSGDQTA
ncbi:IclR family transcriptional regulator [Pusillimonas sp. MFBS29]|uniref:IclR family transcriptional regulator n=1 Tax=Pusillimonas sp. MFBS29 TaxID=2886690 RepID=UPI001D129093|nr:IclR family transcriptional regulator [Pusillimonas sp. MFBS29]MCC2596301.1 IclR family transcriptional regulator [Pusillimonas sp. MFBS29]